MFARLFSRWLFVLALVLALPAARPALAQTSPTPHPAFEVTVTGHGPDVEVSRAQSGLFRELMSL